MSAARPARSRVPLFLLLGVLVLSGCAAKRPPVLEPLRTLHARNPVVLIPGLTGSKLRQRDTGRVVWGSGKSFFLPRDGGYALARPLGEGAGEENLEAFAAVVDVRLLGIIKVDVYAAVIRLMETNGYRHGDLASPGADETFFFFPYDWRDGNVRAARELGRSLERLRVARGEEVLHVDIICQSDAARIARYFIKYGGATLEEAESGKAGPPDDVRVDRLIMVGAAHGGALRTLEDLQRGRSYVKAIGRRFRPETIFTYPSIYEALPAYRDGLFFDAAGRRLAVDLFDPQNWERYGWSIFRPEVRERLLRRPRADLFGDEPQRAAFLARSLDRARRLHRLLMRDVDGFGSTRYYTLQNVYAPTPERALLERRGDGWRTRIVWNRKARSQDYLWSLANAPGDGHATIGSQHWLSPQEHDAFARPPVTIDDGHRKIILNAATHRFILEFLVDGLSANTDR